MTGHDSRDGAKPDRVYQPRPRGQGHLPRPGRLPAGRALTSRGNRPDPTRPPVSAAACVPRGAGWRGDNRPDSSGPASASRRNAARCRHRVALHQRPAGDRRALYAHVLAQPDRGIRPCLRRDRRRPSSPCADALGGLNGVLGVQLHRVERIAASQLRQQPRERRFMRKQIDARERGSDHEHRAHLAGLLPECNDRSRRATRGSCS